MKDPNLLSTEFLKTKYLAGWLKANNMAAPEWLPHWIKMSEDAAEKNMELVVFRIPLDKTGIMADENTLNEIESFLQSKFGK